MVVRGAREIALVAASETAIAQRRALHITINT